MKCKDIRKLLSVRQDGRLNPGELDQVKAHLQNCQACRQEEHALDQAWSMLLAVAPIEPSPDFKARFWQRAREGDSAKQSWWVELVYFWKEFSFNAPPAFALASAIMVSLLGILIALRVAPRETASLDKSPVLQWAQGDNLESKIGGFPL